MNHEQLKALREKYAHAENLRKNIDNTSGLIEAIRRRQAKGSAMYSLGLNREGDGYNSQIYVKVPERVIAAMLPALKSVLTAMREEFKTLPE